MTFRDASAGSHPRRPDTIDILLARYGPAYRVFAVLTTSLAVLASVMPSTMINVALPDIMGAYSIGPDKAQALSSGYLASSTAAMLVTAWMVTSFGMRFTMSFSMIAYACGSVFALLAPDENFLIGARVVQGAAAGLVMPLSMQIIFEVFPENRRATAMGIFSLGVMVTPVVGPTVGGIIIDNLGWRFLFPFEMCVVLSVVPFAMLFMPSERTEGPRPRFDLVGLALLTIFLLGSLYALTNGRSHGWNSDEIITVFSLSFLAGAMFVFWENHVEHPMLNLNVFRNSQFVLVSLVGLALGLGTYGSTVLQTLFLQLIQGYSATDAGAAMILPGIMLAASSVVGGFLGDRFDPRVFIMLGGVLFVGSHLLFSTGDANTPYVSVIIWMIMARAGIGIMSPSLSVISLNVLPAHLIAQGAGATNFIRQIGGALGVNLSGVYLDHQTVYYGDMIARTQDPSNAATAETIGHLQELLARGGLTVWEQMAGAMGYLSRAIYHQAHMLAFRDTFIAMAWAYIAVIALSVFLRRGR